MTISTRKCSSGTPTSTGAQTFDVKVVDPDGNEDTAVLQIDVKSANMVGNASFENGLTGWTLNGNVVLETAGAFGGDQCARVIGSWDQARKDISVSGKDGVEFVLSAMATASSDLDAVGKLQIQFYGSGGYLSTAGIDIPTTTNAWQEFEVSGFAPDGTTEARVYCRTSNSTAGYMLYDDVWLRETDNLLADGGFELTDPDDNWHFWGDGTISRTTASGETQDGLGAVKIVPSDQGWTNIRPDNYYVNQNIEGHEFQLSAYMETDDLDADFVLQIQFYDDSTHKETVESTALSGTNGYSKISIQGIAPTGTDTVRIYIRVKKASGASPWGEAFVDSIRLVDLDAP